MTKKKEDIDIKLETVENEVVAPIVSDPVEMNAVLYKYNVGDEVFTMQDNKVHSFVISKRIILTRMTADGKIVNEVYYDESNWDSLKAQYREESLYGSKKELLASL